MGLKNWFQRNFNTAQYNLIESGYKEAKRNYSKGFAYYLSVVNYSDDPDNYDFKEIIYEALPSIKEYDKVINDYEESKRKYKRGYDSYIAQNNLKESSSYAFKQKISQNKSIIVKAHNTLVQYDSLVRNYSKGVELYLRELGLYNNSVTLQTKEKVCQNESTVKSYSKRYKDYDALQHDCEDGFKYYCKINTLSNDHTIAFIQTILNAKSVIVDYSNVLKGYKSLVSGYNEAVHLFLGKNTGINFNDKRTVVDNKKEILRIQKILNNYDDLVKQHKIGLDLYLKEKGKDISVVSFETKEDVCQNVVTINIYERQHSEYDTLRSNCKGGFTQYCKSKGLSEVYSIDFINRVLKDSKIISEYDDILKDYRRTVHSHKEAVCLYLGVVTTSNITFEQKQSVVNNSLEVLRVQEDLDKFRSFEKLYSKATKYYLNGKELSLDIVKDVIDNKTLLEISEEFINHSIGISTPMLELFGLKQKDIKTISEKTLEQKQAFLDYKKSELDKHSTPMFVMTNNAKAAIQSILNSSKLTPKFKDTSVNTYELCDVIRTLYAHQWTIDRAKKYVRENSDRILLYYKQHEMKPEITVSTLKDVVTDTQLIRFIGFAEEEKKLRARITTLIENNPKGYAAHVRANKIQKYHENLSVEECEKIIKYESSIIDMQAKFLIAEELRKKLDAELRQARSQAKKLVETYPRAISYYILQGKVKQYSDRLPVEDYKAIIALKSNLPTKELELQRNEELIRNARQKASVIKQSYGKGYDYYVRYGRIKPFSTSLSLQELNKIVELESSIISKHREIERQEAEERRRREEAERVNRAKSLASQYSRAYAELFSGLPSFVINSSNCGQILNKESELRSLNSLYSSVSNWGEVKGIPYYFFYYYYPTRFTDISSDSRYARGLIYNFKDGRGHSEVVDMVTSKLNRAFSSSELSSLTLVCIPASTRSVNEERYRSFSRDLCNKTGMRNGFEHIEITREKTPSHLGGSDSAEYSAERYFFNGAKVVLFDDVVTRGHSMAQFKQLLRNAGATVICALSIGRTYSDYYGDNREPHPWTGNI